VTEPRRPPYTWANMVLGPSYFSVHDLGVALGVGRHAARLALVRSGLPAKCLKFVWTYRGQHYRRFAWRIPGRTLERLVALRREAEIERIRAALGRGGHRARWRIKCRMRHQLARSRHGEQQ